MGLEALFALISVLLCLQEAIPQNLENSGDPVIAEARKCRHQHGLTDEEFEEIMRQASLPKEEPIDSRRCFVECVLTSENLLKEGKLNEDQVLKFAQNSIMNGTKPDERRIRNRISACRLQAVTGRCTAGYSAWVCVLEFLENYEV
ncbi:uncharacterized protein LOC111870771 [Cryptotermes secundus]|uniref:uncharacterized protein LOC111870771 n=1 Tax=Cryptotermes secundus TaxID=105785 RepID=UPI000CD7CECC|nr:uncharacterized protein LOC111870771 [Cryptotermes secundus]